MHVIHEAFGHQANLYEILQVDAKTVDKAGLRKAYYKTALAYHPDKNPNDKAAAQKFQGITAVYQILQDEEKRKIYDETGDFGGLDDDDDADDGQKKDNPWKDYFDRIFGRVTMDGINEFAQKYKCSDEERSHVLQHYKSTKGNLIKMLDFVMLSTERDAVRWVEDYIRPAIADKIIPNSYTKTMEKTLQKIIAKVEKEEKTEKQRQQTEEERTDSEQSDNNISNKPKAQPIKKRKKVVETNDEMSSLIAQIQNKKRVSSGGGGGTASRTNFKDFAARYGVTEDITDDDPLADDDAFRRAQAKINPKKTKKKK